MATTNQNVGFATTHNLDALARGALSRVDRHHKTSSYWSINPGKNLQRRHRVHEWQVSPLTNAGFGCILRNFEIEEIEAIDTSFIHLCPYVSDI
jgi:hypothetical protein